jgi:hypothetical protein
MNTKANQEPYESRFVAALDSLEEATDRTTMVLAATLDYFHLETKLKEPISNLPVLLFCLFIYDQLLREGISEGFSIDPVWNTPSLYVLATGLEVKDCAREVIRMFARRRKATKSDNVIIADIMAGKEMAYVCFWRRAIFSPRGRPDRIGGLIGHRMISNLKGQVIAVIIEYEEMIMLSIPQLKMQE